MKKNYYIHYFDYIRFMAMICVIYMHGAAIGLRGTINADWHFINIITSFSFIAVSLFFMMSGYLLLSNPKTLDIAYLVKKRIPRLLFTLFFWTIVAIFWRIYQQNTILSLKLLFDYFVKSFTEPIMTPFWYVYTLMCLYVVSPIIYGGIKSLDKKGHQYVIACIVFVIFFVSLTYYVPIKYYKYFSFKIINSLFIFDGFLLIFILGYYLGNLKKKISNKLLIFIAAVTLLIITLGTYIVTIKKGEYNQVFQSQNLVLEVLLSSCIFILFKQNYNKKSKFLSKIPIIRFSLAIYFVHSIVFNIIFKIGIVINTFSETIVFTIINFIVSYLIVKTLATIKPLCYISTGITYKNACDSCNWIWTFKNLKTRLK